jgi:hypothetical protein
MSVGFHMQDETVKIPGGFHIGMTQLRDFQDELYPFEKYGFVFRVSQISGKIIAFKALKGCLIEF